MKYHLHAILVHSGSLNSGHYYCFIRPDISAMGDDGKPLWYKFDDKIVTKVDQEVAFEVAKGGYTSTY